MFFNNYVTFPFFNCVKQPLQDDFVMIRGGPATTPEELQYVLKGTENQQKMLKTEIS